MEGEIVSKRNKRVLSANDFTEVVFSWSVEDIFDDNLYKDQVKQIPESFETTDDYLESFVYPLLEEARAGLCSTMEVMGWAPFAEVLTLDESNATGMFTYNVKVNSWQNRLIDCGRELYKLLPGDVLVISESKPESVCDLLRMHWEWDFALVICPLSDNNELEDDRSSSTAFRIKSSSDLTTKFGDKKPLYVVFLQNITTYKRTWSSLHMRQNLNLIRQVLGNETLDAGSCSFCPHHDKIPMDKRIQISSEFGLNDSQTEAILTSTFHAKCDQNSHVELILGPPGTGKTRTISVILFSLLRLNVRTLSCAPTNVAVKEVAARVVNLRKSFQTDSSNVDDAICPLGEILLFGNKDKLKVGSVVEEIYLEYRVKLLQECLDPFKGWKPCITAMIDFMEDCLTRYEVFVENEKIKIKQENNRDEIPKENLKSLLQFCRDKFVALSPPLRRSMIILCTHVPKSFILEQNFRDMLHLIFLLESLEALLFQETLTSVELEDLFSHQQQAISEDSVNEVDDRVSSLKNTRKQCLHTLKNLQYSLGELSFPRMVVGNSLASLMDFCYKNACLIFCTASSSFKLHHVDMEPIDLLVIDEAAQLKECESIIPLQLVGLKHAILVGDERQLPAIVNSKVSEDVGFGRSLFERLSSLGHSKKLLNIQYRMHPEISLFPNSNFYDNKIQDAPLVKRKGYERRYLVGKMYGPYSFINVAGGKEERVDDEYSIRNMVEVAVAMKLLQKLHKAWNGSDRPLSIGLISPYAAQVAALQQKVCPKYENIDGFSVKVKSIDGFQGGEEDIIIFSAVRANNGGSIGFLESQQRTNVALTRARYCLWILGNERTLSKRQSIWETIILDAKDRQCYFDAHDDSDLSKTILDVKKEMDELDDLVSGDSILFEKGKWKVTFSDIFRRSFAKLMSVQKKKLVINLLLKLASGWRPRRKGVDSICESSSHVVKKFKVEGRYVICSIDIVKEGNYKQVLKVWDILSLDEISKLISRLDSIFCMYTDDFINRCNEKCLEGDLEVPKTWSASLNLIRYKDTNTSFGSDSGDTINGRSYIENSRVNESLLLMKFYSLSSGIVNHLLTYDAAGELDLPFEVTDEEEEVIQFPKSSFILGRSGTGKTTVLTMKLFQKEQLHRLAIEGYATAARGKEPTPYDVMMSQELDRSIIDDEETVLRQLFVTVSSKLCYAVKQHVSRLKSFACGGKNLSGTSSFDVEDMDEMDHFKDLPDSFMNIPAEKYPLVITFQHFLMMLDETLGDSYFKRFDEIRVSSESSTRYKSVALQKFIRMKEVNFDRFYLVYWPHLNVQLTKNLDPSRVFTEIISHIKGGLQAGDAPDCKLSREIYISMSDTRASTLSAEERGRVYDIFKDYEKMKMERGEFDLADFVMDLHLRLKREGLKCAKMDFVYIDEVQDLTMRQLSLFKYICQNVDEGFVFSGDTAQTIARGIDFRFEDIRSLFYTEFLTQPKDDNQSRKEKGRVSEMFNLYQNFRTHAGVLRLAQSVIDLLCHYFRQSVDFLRPESSLIYGEAPVLLEPGSDENAIVKIFGNAENSGGKIVGFGAEQVILVRDDSARKEISGYVGRNALVLTILECKGLEFQDVLLYNFFSESPLNNQWRVIYEYMKKKDLLEPKLPQCFPSFSHGRHCIMCSELKQLYVAITRTRQRLWICENKEELSKPMFDYWKKLCLVQVKKVDDSLAQAMQIASSPAEWKSRGVKLYWEKNYEMATLCFERAGDTYWEKRAKASALRTTAEYMRASNNKQSCSILREAAEIFHSIGQAESAAECFCDLGEFERAGRIYLEKCGESELLKAGECFTLAKCYKQAAEAYAKGNHFSNCLSACKDGKLFDLGLQYIESWRKQSQQCDNTTGRSEKIETIKQEFLESCAGSYFESDERKSMLKFVRAFCSMDSKRYFLKSKGCIDELLLLEQESGNFKEAADIARQIGDVLLEADLLGKAGCHKEASLLIIAYVMSNSLWANGSRGWPPKQFPRMKVILEKARSFAKQDSNHLHEIVCREAMVLSSEPLTLPVMLQYLCYSRNHESLRLESLSVMKILDAHLCIGAKKFAWDNELPDDLKRYSEGQISQNQVSGRTLIYFWNLWFESMMNVIKHVQGIKTPNIIKHTSIDEFCLNYFGVRRLGNDLDTTYALLNPDAQWVRKADCKYIGKTKNFVWIDADQFSLDAQSCCHAEISSVGLRVLETLESLYDFSKRNSFSSFSQGMCLTDIYQVTALLMDFFKCNDNVKWKLRRFLQLAANYFENVFPLDCRGSLVKNMISLRETDGSRNLLKEIIDQNIIGKGKSELTYDQLGRVAMVLLGNGKKLTGEVWKKISERLDVNLPWKKFLTTLKMSASGEFQGNVSLVEDFHWALTDTFNANWRVKDYIEPHSFLYLVERLLIMVGHSRDSFYTTKCSFTEWIMYLDSGAYPVASSVADRHSSHIDIIFDSLRTMIHQLLHLSQDTKLWICGRSGYPVNYYSLVVQRMVIILCLLCLNTGKHFGVVFDIISRMEYQHLLSYFIEPLRRGMRRNHAIVNINMVAEAFKRVGIPLVVVSLRKNSKKIACPDAIFVDVGDTTQRDDILGILFPKDKSFDCRLIPTKNATMPNPYGALATNVNDHTGGVVVSQKASSTTTGGGEGNQKFRWVCFEEIIGALKAVHDPSTLASRLLKHKVQLEENIKFLGAVLSTDKSRLVGFYDEASSMLEELMLLSSLLDVSNLELNGNLDCVEQVMTSIVSKRESLESFLNQLGGCGGPDNDKEEDACLDDDTLSCTLGSVDSESRDKPKPVHAASSGSGSKEVEEEDRVKSKEENKGKVKGKGKGNNKSKGKGNNKSKGKSKGGKKK